MKIEWERDDTIVTFFVVAVCVIFLLGFALGHALKRW